MRTAYLKRREPFEAVLAETLSAGWSRQHAADIRVLPPEEKSGRCWLLHPWLNGYCAEHPGPAVRHFLRDNFRQTPVSYRAPLQWAIGTLLTYPRGLQVTGRPGFRVEGPLPGQQMLLVVPGNHRLRVFDFAVGRSRVFLKKGFDACFMQREVEVRGLQRGPFPPLSAWGEAYDWFEEPILPAVPLVRVRSRAGRAAYAADALRILDHWLDRSRREGAVEDRLWVLESTIESSLRALGARMEAPQQEQLRRWRERLADRASRLACVPLAFAHGDMMSDNILVDENRRQVYLIDWERCEERFFWYDHFVYALDSRLPAGLARRLQRFVVHGSDHPWLARLPANPAWRQAALALFLLEDLATNLTVNALNPFYTVAEDLRTYLQELSLFMELQEREAPAPARDGRSLPRERHA